LIKSFFICREFLVPLNKLKVYFYYIANLTFAVALTYYSIKRVERKISRGRDLNPGPLPYQG